MAKRKKTRTHKSQPTTAAVSTSPKTFVIKSVRGHHGQSSANGLTGGGYSCASLNLLVKDFRKVMEPNTASHLKERKSNRFKDFLAMAGPLGVTHMIVFSQSLPSKATNTTKDEEIISPINMKIYKVPRGPTLSFKVLRYSLMIDVLNCDKNPRSPGQEFKTEPLLIMNNFNPSAEATTDEANQLNLLTTTFRNLFPQIKIHEVQLVQTRRIVLLSYNPVTKTIDFRHYLITVKPVGVSKKIRTLMEGALVNNTRPNESSSEMQKGKKKMRKILDLSCVEDVSEYVLGKTKLRAPGSSASSAGFTAARSEGTMTEAGDESDYDGVSSGGEDESENETNQRKIELPQNYLGKGNVKNSKKSVKLKELGPRMELGLVKIEQGLGNGDVLFHEFIKKTKQEDMAIKKAVQEKEKLRKARKAEQDANVKKKRLALEQQKQAKADKRKDKHPESKGEGSTKDESGDENENDDEAEKEEEEEEESEIDEEAEYSDLFDDEEEMEGAESSDMSDLEPDQALPSSSTTTRTKKKVKFIKG